MSNDNELDFSAFDADGFDTDFELDGGIQPSNNQGQEDFDDSFSDSNEQDNSTFNNQFDMGGTNDSEPNKSTKKTALIAIGLGVGGLILVLIIASLLNNAVKNKKSDTQVESQVIAENSNVNVDNIMQENNQYVEQPSTNTQTTVTNVVQDEFVWSTITDSEQVTFNNEYTDMVFTVTGIEHRARAVDANNNLLVKTTLTGSVSGLSGTYQLDVPYNKGIKLVVGNSFNVHVQLGSYNGKTVVGEIKY